MSTHRVFANTPGRMDAQRFAVNGKTPAATAFRRYADAFNHISGYQKKQWTCRSVDLSNVIVPSSGAVYTWQGYIRTGEATDMLRIHVGLVKTSFVTASSPEWTMYCKIPGGATIATVNHQFNQRASGASVDPSDIHHAVLKMEGLSPNTEYRIETQATNGARGVYMRVMEDTSRFVSTATTGICNPGAAKVEGDIYDEDIGFLVTANNEAWQHNGAPLFCWNADYENSTTGAGIPVITTGTTYADVFSTPKEVTLSTLYHNTLMRTTVPVGMAVLADRTAGTGTLSVRLTDGTNHVECTGIGDGGNITWTTAATTMPAATTSTWHLEAKHSDGATTHRLYAVYIWPYEA